MMTTTMKKCIALALSAALALSVTACGSSDAGKNTSESTSGSVEITGEDVQRPNPWQDFQTLEEAIEAVGFDFTVPAAPDGCDKTVYQAIAQEEDKIIEALYYSGEEQVLDIRKAPGSENISGVYIQFEQLEQVTVDGRDVTMSGNGDAVELATWTDGAYSYSVYAAGGLSQSDMAQLVSQVQ